MSLLQWLRGVNRRPASWTSGPRSGPGRRRAVPLRLEVLEDRSLPSVAAPLPIPGGFTNPTGGPFIHFNFPGPADAAPIFGNEPSTITDFNGDIGVAHVNGTGTGTDATGATSTLYFTVDVRFMRGVYQGVDGNLHQATFAEV